MLTRRQKTAFLALASSVCAAGLLAFALGAGATVTARSDGFESGSLSGWDSSNTTSRSTLTVATTHAFDGLYGAHAAISADSTATNTYARTIWQPNWQLGDDVWYSGSFYFPTGFKSNMQGEVDVMRWDNFGSYPNCEDQGGLVIFNSDKAFHVVLWPCTGGGGSLVTGPTISEGSWHFFQVHQRFSSTSPLTELYIDGQLVGSSTAHNYNQLPIDRLRYGLVAIAAGAQTNALDLWFDHAAISTTAAAPH